MTTCSIACNLETVARNRKFMAAGGAGLPRGAAPPDPGPLPPTQPAGINWRFARSRALIAAIILAVLVSIPATGPFFIIWVPLCGALAVFLYQKRFPATPISSGTGARMALSAGAIAFLILVVLFAVASLVEHFVAHHSVLAELRAQVVTMMKTTPNPQAAQVMDVVNSDGGLISLLAAGSIVVLVLFLALSAIGGAIQAHIIKPTGSR
jgi:hypothetical protein